MTTRATNHEIEILSAYLDEQLSASERVKVDNMVQQNSELNELLNDLRQLRTLLRSQPHPRAPRNFMLTPAMLGEYRARTVTVTWFQRMRLVSALASMAFVLVLLGDLLGLSGRVAAPLLASAPAMNAAPTLSQEFSLQQEAAPQEGSPGALEMQITQAVEDAVPAAKMVAPAEASPEAPPGVSPEASPEALLALQAAPYPLPTGTAGIATVPDENTPPASSKMAPEATPTVGASAVAQTEPDALALDAVEDSGALATAAEERQGAQVGPVPWNSLRLAALLLAILAAVSGIFAFIFWQKSQA